MRTRPMVLAAMMLAATLFVSTPRAEAGSLAGLCVAFDQNSDVTWIDHTLQWNGSTWVWTQIGTWQRYPNGGHATACRYNFNIPTYKLLYWWNYFEGQANLWTYATSGYVAAAAPN